MQNIDEDKNKKCWEINFPDPSGSGDWHAETGPMTYAEALAYAQEHYSADGLGRICIINKIDAAVDGPPKPSLIEAAVDGTIASLSASEFWDIIEPFGWGTTTTDSETIKVALLRRLTRGQAGGLRDQLDSLTGALHKRLRAERVELECGDDSYQDLLAHVVGLGRVEYEKALADPRLLRERYNKGAFTESFSYALPYPSDFDALSLSHYQGRAADLRPTYEALVQDEAFQKILPSVQVVVAALSLVAEGKIDEVLRCEKTTRDAADAIAAFYREQAERAATRYRLGAFAIDGGSAGNPHGVHNLFIDLRRYFIPFQEKSA